MKWVPKEIDRVNGAFPTSVEGFLPPYGSVPDEFKHGHGNKWAELVSRWFFRGLPKGTEFIPVEGIDKDKALRHVKYCLGSWEPKHEHKEAGVAYLMSLWFKEVNIPANTEPAKEVA